MGVKRMKLREEEQQETSQILVGAQRQSPPSTESTLPIEERSVNHVALSLKYPELKPFLVNGTIDWLSALATQLYNCALVKEWFNIKLDLPNNHLCPTALSRTRYIRWIETLVKHCSDKEIVGIDVGTGASCIYPLLGKAIYDWKFIATDIDEESLQWASKNVNQNGWSSSISVVQALRVAENPSLSGLVDSVPRFHILDGALDASDERKMDEKSPTFSSASFTMCNPPFFENPDDKVKRVDTVCIATDGELSTSGGEVEFVKQMIRESAQLGTRISWYTTLLGKKSSLNPLLDYLKTFNPLDIQQTAFTQGRNTRWTIAWTFCPNIKASVIAERASAIRFTEDRFIFDTDFFNVLELEAALSQTPLGLRLRKVSDWASTVSIYENSSWIKSTFEGPLTSSSASYSNQAALSIGPGQRPKLLFSIAFCIIKFPHRAPLSVLCDFKAGDHPKTTIGGTEYPTRHLFGVLVRELKTYVCSDT
jgi:23S rRNA A1618 N6-methylase RlmF